KEEVAKKTGLQGPLLDKASSAIMRRLADDNDPSLSPKEKEDRKKAREEHPAGNTLPSDDEALRKAASEETDRFLALPDKVIDERLNETNVRSKVRKVKPIAFVLLQDPGSPDSSMPKQRAWPLV